MSSDQINIEIQLGCRECIYIPNYDLAKYGDCLEAIMPRWLESEADDGRV
jgi:hypothetical protein